MYARGNANYTRIFWKYMFHLIENWARSSEVLTRKCVRNNKISYTYLPKGIREYYERVYYLFLLTYAIGILDFCRNHPRYRKIIKTCNLSNMGYFISYVYAHDLPSRVFAFNWKREKRRKTWQKFAFVRITNVRNVNKFLRLNK